MGGGPLVLGLWRAEVAGAGAAVAQHAAAVDEPLALLVAAARQRQHGEVQALHALDGELAELLEAEVARGGARVRVREVARGGAREGVVVLARARLQLDGLGVAAQVARGDQHARGAGRGPAVRAVRAVRLLRVGALQRRLAGRRGRRARARRHGRPEPAGVVRRRQLFEYCMFETTL